MYLAWLVHRLNLILLSSFRRPFVKRFALCYRAVVCPVCPVLSCHVTLAYCGQTVGRIKMKLGTQVGLGTGHIVLDGDQASPPQKKKRTHHQFSTHVCCGQTSGYVKMPLGTEVGFTQAALC